MTETDYLQANMIESDVKKNKTQNQQPNLIATFQYTNNNIYSKWN